MNDYKLKGKKVLFFVGAFPIVSETFIINQVADLLDRGVDVRIFSLLPGNKNMVSDRFFDYQMSDRTVYLNLPKSKITRLFKALPKIIKILLIRPTLFFKVFNFKRYGQFSWSLKALFWTEPFMAEQFDLIHCHFGTIANKFLLIKEILSIKAPLVVSFYGYDVSQIVVEKGLSYYNRLKEEAQAYIVMSENMKSRLVSQGFVADKISILPASIDVQSYPFLKREFKTYPVNLISVGRFVEKKGFPDLLRATKLVADKLGENKIRLHIVGDGPLKSEILSLVGELRLESIVKFYGYQKVEDIIKLFTSMDIYLQTSKMACNGDME